jgi:conjugative transfer region protein TrbK
MRGRLLSLRAIRRAAGFALVAAAIAATAVRFAHDASRARPHPAEASTPADPLASELHRCQALVMAAKDNAACEAAWAENRRRFFTYRPAPSAVAAPAAAGNSSKQ